MPTKVVASVVSPKSNLLINRVRAKAPASPKAAAGEGQSHAALYDHSKTFVWRAPNARRIPIFMSPLCNCIRHHP